jgi:AraC-like DNA-binding protein
MGGAVAVLELVARGAAAGALVVMAMSLGRSGSAAIRISGVLFALGAASHALLQSNVIGAALGPVAVFPWALSAMGAGLLWTFIGTLFGDRTAPDPRRFLPAAALLALGLLGEATSRPWTGGFWMAHKIIGAALILHALVLVAAGWRNDLVERRRRLRGPVMAMTAAYALVITLIEAAGILGWSLEMFRPLAATVLLAMSLAGAAVFLRPESELLNTARPAPLEPAGLSGQDRVLLAALTKALDQDEAWRREALTLGELARLLATPEHRLRRLINTQLGYRNFTTLLNERRIAAAKAALGDPGRASASVSTIAYEVGFGSLGPFNRAFKLATGATPSAWRDAALGGSPIPKTVG